MHNIKQQLLDSTGIQTMKQSTYIVEDTLSTEVREDITEFITTCWSGFIEDAKEYGSLDLTVATNDSGTTWNYQTGDNSFTGGAYSLPHWAVDTVYTDSSMADFISSILDQLSELVIDNNN